MTDPAEPTRSKEIEGAKVIVARNDKLGMVDKVAAVVTMSAWVFALVASPFVTLYLVYQSLVNRSAGCSVALALVVVTVFLPRRVRVWPAYASGAVFRLWRSFFGFTVLAEFDTLDPERRYLFAEHPHGLFPVGPLLAQTLAYTLRERECETAVRVFGSRHITGGVADAILWLPFWRYTIGWLGIVSASRASLEREFAEGNNVCLFPGGIAEGAIDDSDGNEHVFLQSRKGFVRLALQCGADLVPSFHLGSSRVLRQLHSPFLARLSRKLRFSLFLMVPWIYPQRIFQVIGKPIHVEKTPNPTKEQIDALHNVFVSELARLFDQYKPLVGWQSRKLIIH